MNLCREVAEKLLLLRDGELPEEEEPFVREHLQYCPGCIELVGGYDEICAVLQRLKPVNMPVGIMERCKERMRRELAGEPHPEDEGPLVDGDGTCCE